MDIDDNLADSTDLVTLNPSLLTYPNSSTEVVCSVIEEICPNLEYLQLSDFKGSFRLHVEKYRGDHLAYKFLLNSIAETDWDFVGAELKERQDVQN
jgi:hypothetical protein